MKRAMGNGAVGVGAWGAGRSQEGASRKGDKGDAALLWNLGWEGASGLHLGRPWGGPGFHRGTGPAPEEGLATSELCSPLTLACVPCAGLPHLRPFPLTATRTPAEQSQTWAWGPGRLELRSQLCPLRSRFSCA